MVDRLWTQIEQTLEGMAIFYERVRVYQDGLPVCGHELEIVSELAKAGSRNHQLLLELKEKGATTMGSESSELLVYNAGQLSTDGIRVVVQQRFSPELTATLNYSWGGVLDLASNDVALSQVRSAIHQEWRHSLGVKLAGDVPGTHTRWASSYRAANRMSLTPVDMFDCSPGQMDPYWNVFIRQPIPGSSFLPAKMEALVDLRNLLAQGYVPVIGRDGRTVYLVQSARAVRGGLAFVF